MTRTLTLTAMLFAFTPKAEAAPSFPIDVSAEECFCEWDVCWCDLTRYRLHEDHTIEGFFGEEGSWEAEADGQVTMVIYADRNGDGFLDAYEYAGWTAPPCVVGEVRDTTTGDVGTFHFCKL